MRGLDVRQHGDSLVVAVQVRPRARPGVEVGDAGLVIRVAEPPDKGKATEAARRALAAALDVRPTAVALRSGRTSRRKTFTVDGLDAVTARQRLLSATG